MAQSYPDIIGDRDWQDIVDVHPEIANQRVTIQAKGSTFNHVYFGGAEPPAERDGLQLPSGVSATGTAAHIWVRGDCRYAILVED
jgi:hypothetical protein